MKFLILVLLFSCGSVFANETSLCLNKEFSASRAGMQVKAGKYPRIGGTESNTIYSVDSDSVSGKQNVVAIKVAWTKQYIGKQNICFITSDNGSFCGLVKTGGEKIKPFEKC
jgi:hypothetical protein